MTLFFALVIACISGMALGLFYFGGLWLTVRQLPRHRRPLPLFLGSFLGRTALVVIGFYFVMDGRWERMLVCLIGFIVARQLLTSRLSRSNPHIPARQTSGK